MMNGDKKIRTSGAGEKEGYSLQISIAEDNGELYWKIDDKWLLYAGDRVSVTKNQDDQAHMGNFGDAVFAENGIDTESTLNSVVFTLSDGTTKIILPRTYEIKIFDSFDSYLSKAGQKMELALNIKKGSYLAIKAEITTNAGTGVDIITSTRAASAPWSVALNEPKFDEDGNIIANATVEFTYPSGITNGETALLKITVIDNNGKEHAATRVIVYGVDMKGVSFEKNRFLVTTEKPETLVPVFEPADATNKNVTWEVENPAIASVASDGTVKGLSFGKTTVTVTTEDGNHTAACTVDIVPALKAEASSSAELFSISGIELVIDGNLDTFWENEYHPVAPLPHWVRIDLGTLCYVYQAEMWRRDSGAGRNDIRVCTLQYSTDIDRWTDVEEYLFTEIGDRYRMHTFETPIKARYIRYYITESNRPPSAGIAEIALDRSVVITE